MYSINKLKSDIYEKWSDNYSINYIYKVQINHGSHICNGTSISCVMFSATELAISKAYSFFRSLEISISLCRVWVYFLMIDNTASIIEEVVLLIAITSRQMDLVVSLLVSTVLQLYWWEGIRLVNYGG